MRWKVALGLTICLLSGVVRAEASLTAFQSFVGNYGVSTDGFGSTTQSGTISASVPVGATVVAAYLYTSTFSNPTLAGVGSTLNGTPVVYTGLPANTPSSGDLRAARADVTSIVASVANGGSAVPFNFTVTETNGNQDGEALVVVYSLASLPEATIGILDGFSLPAGDSASINFAVPLAPAAPGFFAEMRLGIGFSFDGAGCASTGQSSNVTVNGTLITQNSGCNDDSADVAAANGNLITVGGFDDPFSPMLPSIAADHERYNLVPFIGNGSTTISINTLNPSNNDNIFLAVFNVSGRAGINAPPPDVPSSVPEPGTVSLFALGAAALVGRMWRHQRSNGQVR